MTVRTYEWRLNGAESWNAKNVHRQPVFACGLAGMQLIVSDAHAGLKAARQAVFSGLPWQRCQFHLQQNAQAYVPRKELQTEVAEDIRIIFNAPDRASAEQYLAKTVPRYVKSASRLADWLEENIHVRFGRFLLPRWSPAQAAHYQRVRTGQPGGSPQNISRQHFPQ
ncbi:MAG TPA: transposase [Anaerolineaceae bacterium]|nr:transposase [Anaerolineaceae bacterium]